MTSLKIGSTEIAGYIKMDGFSWQRQDLDGEGAGRTTSGKTIRDLVATKIRLDCTCKPLTSAERTALETLLFGSEFLSVACTDSIFRGTSPRKMYCSAMSGGFSHRIGSTEYWKDVKFVLVEQ